MNRQRSSTTPNLHLLSSNDQNPKITPADEINFFKLSITMSNQCSNLLAHRSFHLFNPFHRTLKLYSTTLRPIFPFDSNLITASSRSRGARRLCHPSAPLAAQSSPDIVLIATTEHHDGSLLFRFGDASEVMKNDEVVEEIESKAKCESNDVKDLEGDQKTERIAKTIEREYGSGDGIVTGVADGIRNVDIDSDIAQRETNTTSDLRDDNAESSKRLSDVSEDEVLSFQSDDKTSNSLEVVESTLDTRASTAQLDGDESLNPVTTSVLDNEDNSLDREGTLLKDTDDETEGQSVSVKFEAMQVSHNEEMGVDKPYAEDELRKVENEDTSESDTKDLMPSHVEFTDAASKDMEEGLQDTTIDEGTLIDEMPLSDPSGAEPILDEVSQFHSTPVKLEATTQVSATEAIDVKDRVIEAELQEVTTNNRDENDIAYVMRVSGMVEAEPILEKEVSQLQLAPVELIPTMQVSDIEAEDLKDQNLDDGILRVMDEDADESYIKDLAPSSNPLDAEAVQDERVNQNKLEQCTETDELASSILLKQDANGSLSEAERIEGKENSSELAEVSEDEAIPFAPEAKVRREEIYFLSSGAALLEHPSKALTGGDDAYFVAGNKWLGVANGVSQWSFEGTNPGVFAKELMKACQKIVLDNSGVMSNPAEIICRGIKETNISGSSNVLIANFDDQVLHVANIGDTGFLIIRHGATYKKSSPLLHEFHFALQVEECDDPLQLLEEYRIDLDEGDIVVFATDGLFDNLYEREIAVIVSKSLQAWIKPEEIAKILATRAQEVGRSALVRSPFSDAAQAAGYTGFAGGKPDNVAVIVSLVAKRSNLVAG